METKTEPSAELGLLGFSLAIHSGPTAARDSEGWLHLAYVCGISFQGREIWRGDFRTGTGWIDLKKLAPRANSSFFGVPENLQGMWNLLERQPYANPKNKALELEFYAWACKQKREFEPRKGEPLAVKLPTLADILSSLLSDGGAFFNAESFEDWARNCGYDTDSRKAEGIYRACMEIGRQLTAGLPPEILEKCREILEDY